MKAIKAMNGRGGKEVAMDANWTGNSSVSGAFSNRKDSGSRVAVVASRTGNESNFGSAFYESRGGKEYAQKTFKG